MTNKIFSGFVFFSRIEGHEHILHLLAFYAFALSTNL